jgi:hypothetical protein
LVRVLPIRGGRFRTAWTQKAKLVGDSLQAGSLWYFALRTGARGMEIILQGRFSHPTSKSRWRKVT